MAENPTRTLEITYCLLCGSDSTQHTHFETHNGEAGVDHYLICQRCGMIFQSPRLNQEDLDTFYSASYREMVQGSVEPTEKDLRIQHARAKHLVHFLQDRLEKIARCLDIGSSTGILLNAVRDRYQCEVMGVEPGDAYRGYSQDAGVPAVKNLENLDKEQESSFDLITMGHTLEHLPEPLPYLRNIRQCWLKEDGYLLIEVPNLYGHTSFELAHLTAFTAQTLSNMLAQAGFEVVKIRTHGKPRSSLIPLYITALAVVRSGSSQPQSFRANHHRIRFSRTLGMIWNRLSSRFLTRWAWLPWPELD